MLNHLNPEGAKPPNYAAITDILATVTPSMEDNHLKALETVRKFESERDLPMPFKKQLENLRTDTPNVVILYDGGTGVMKHDTEGELIPTQNIAEVARLFKIKGVGREVNVLWLQHAQRSIDSMNTRWPRWVSMGNAIKWLHSEFPDTPNGGGISGFVLFSGTDGMDYLLSALGYMYPNIGLPIVGMGGQKSVYETVSDASPNLDLALAASTSNLRGVYQAFGGKIRDGMHIHKVRAESFLAFDCLPGYEIGEYSTNQGLILKDSRPKRRNVPKDNLIYRPYFREDIKVVQLSPSISAASLFHDALDPLKNVLLFRSIGVSGVRNEPGYEGDITHTEVFDILHKEGFSIVFGSEVRLDGSINEIYQPTAETLRTGIISGRNTTGASLVTKAMMCEALAYKKGETFDPEEFARQMKKEHVHEFSTRII